MTDIVYSVSWSRGKLFVLKLSGRTGEFEVLDSVSTGGEGLNFIELLPGATGLVGACVRLPFPAHLWVSDVKGLIGSIVPDPSSMSLSPPMGSLAGIGTEVRSK